MPAYSISKIKDPLKKLIQLKIPVLLVGPTGLGKSSIIKEIAKELGRKVIDLRLSQMEFSDLRGIPFISKEENVKWSVPHFFPTDENDNSIIFLDEINTAHSSILSAAYQLVLDRQIGEYILPKGVSIIAAGNRLEDNDELTDIPKPLLNRFCHIEVKYNFESWLNHANSTFHKSVIDYLTQNKSDLFYSSITSNAFATPRTWERVSDILKSYQDQDVTSDLHSLQILVESCLGESSATKFLGFLKKKNKISVDFGKILSNPSYKIKDKVTYDLFHYLKTGIYEALDSKHGENLGKLKNLPIQEKTIIYTELDNALLFIQEHCDSELWVSFLHFLTRECKIFLVDSFMPNYRVISRTPEIKEIVSKL